MIELSRLQQVVSYQPETGAFVWGRGKRGRGCKAGAVAGRTTERGYWRISIDGETYRAHRLAWLWMTGEWPSDQIDHINGDKSDNRWANLRLATNSQNHANRPAPKTNTSGLKGACWHRGKGRWWARIVKDSRGHHLGYFDTKEEAHAAYVAAAIRLFGDFARAA